MIVNVVGCHYESSCTYFIVYDTIEGLSCSILGAYTESVYLDLKSTSAVNGRQDGDPSSR